jgi:hypothetical protein
MAIRLLRVDTLDLLYAPLVTAILQACEMLDPEAGRLVDGYHNDLLGANAGWSMERLLEWIPEMSLPADKDAARQELEEFVSEETERLKTKLKRYEEEAEIRARYDGDILAFDGSSKGELMRRYETKWQRYVDGFLKESRQRRSKDAAKGYSPAQYDYAKLRPPAFARQEGPIGSREKADLDRFMESFRNRERARTPEPAAAAPAPKAMTDVQRSDRTEAAVPNEPKSPGERSLPHAFVNQEVTPEKVAVAGSEAGNKLRNEPKPAGAGTHRGIKEPKAWDNSRRARRAREAMGRASGSRELEKALNRVGPRARNLLIPVGLA